MRSTMRLCSAGLLLALVCLAPVFGWNPAARPERIDPAGIRGSLVICGGGELPDAVFDRFLDLAGGTEARLVEKELHALLRRGGVIGGTSAGASFQAEYLARGNPLGNRQITAEGYERGFGFLKGVAIDQHFTQRNRHDDLRSLIRTYPQLLGIGIDEQTALIVRDHIAEVKGNHKVFCFDGAKLEPTGRVHFAVGENGEH